MYYILYLAKNDPSLIFTNNTKQKQNILSINRIPRHISYTTMNNHSNVKDVESVIHSTPTLNFTIPFNSSSNMLKRNQIIFV